MSGDKQATIEEAILEVRILDPVNVIYQGLANSVSSTNAMGPFDILPFHSNFITLIADKLSLIDNKGEFHAFPIQKGVLVCKKNRIQIFLGF